MNELLLRRRVAAADDEIDVEWLKSLGCIAYFPLNGKYGLMDIVGGKSISILQDSSGAYFRYNGTTDMYRIHLTSSKNVIAQVATGWDSTTFPSNEYSCIVLQEAIDRGTSENILDNSLHPLVLIRRDNSAYVANWSDKSLGCACMICKSNSRIVYDNRTITINDTTNASPSTKGYINYINFQRGNQSSSSSANSDMLYGNLMIFNRAISESEYFAVLNKISKGTL